MDDLLAPPPSLAPKKKTRKKKRSPTMAPSPKHPGVHVHVNVTNASGHAGPAKKTNEADDVMRMMRGY